MSKSLIMKVRLFLVALMTVAFVLGAGIFGFSAKAEGEFSIKQITYEMDGASIRIGEADGVNGLKFTAKMSKTDYARIEENVGEGKTYSSIEYGVLIMPDYYANYYPLNEATVFGVDGAKVYDWATLEDGEWVYRGDNKLPAAGGNGVRIINIYTNEWIEGSDKFTYSGSIVEIKDGSVGGVNNLAQEMYSKAYIKATKADGGVDYLFSSNFKCMSAAYVAQKTIELNTLTPAQNAWLQENYVDKAQADFEASLINGGEILLNVNEVKDLTAVDLTKYIDAEHLETVYGYQRFALTYEMNGYATADTIKVSDLTKVDMSGVKQGAYVLNIKVGKTIVYTLTVDLYDPNGEFVWNDSVSKASLAVIDYAGDNKEKTDFYTRVDKAGKPMGNPTEVEIDGKQYVSFTADGDNGSWYVWKPLHIKEYYENFQGKGVVISVNMIIDASGIVATGEKDFVVNQAAIFGTEMANSIKTDMSFTRTITLDEVLADWDHILDANWDGAWGSRYGAGGMLYTYNIHNGGIVYIGDFSAKLDASLVQTVKGGDLLVNVENVADLTSLNLTSYIGEEGMAVINSYKPFGLSYEMKGYSIAGEIEVTDLENVDVSSAKRAAYVLNVKVGDIVVYTALVDLYNTTDKVVWAESLTEYNVVTRYSSYSGSGASGNYYTPTVNSKGSVPYEIVDSFTKGSTTYTGSFVKFNITEIMVLSFDIRALHTKSYYNELIGDTTKVLQLGGYASAGSTMHVMCGMNNFGINAQYVVRGRQGFSGGKLESFVFSLDNDLLATSAEDTYHGNYYDYWERIEGTNVGMCRPLISIEVTTSMATAEGGWEFYLGLYDSWGHIVDGGETLTRTLATTSIDLVNNESFDLINLLPESQHAKFKAYSKLWYGKNGKNFKGNAIGFVFTINGTTHCVVPNANGEAILHRDDYVVGQDGKVSTTTRVRDLLTAGENVVTFRCDAPGAYPQSLSGWPNYVIAPNTKVTILWDEIAIHTVTFDGNGGTLVSGTEVQEIENGKGAVAPVYTKDRHVFAGWDKTFDVVTESMTITALWTPIVYHNVTFDGNGGTLVAGSALQEVEDGYSATAPTFEKEGYVFMGFDKTFDVITEDITVTAKWLKLTAIDELSIMYVTGNADFDLESLLDEETKSTIRDLMLEGIVVTLKDNNGNVVDMSSNWTLDFTDYSALRVWEIEFKYGDIVFYTNTIDFVDTTAPFVWNDVNDKSSIQAITYESKDKKQSYYELGKGNPTNVTVDGADYVSFTASGGNGTWFAWTPLHSKAYYELYQGKGLALSATLMVDVTNMGTSDTQVLNQQSVFGVQGSVNVAENMSTTRTKSIDDIVANWSKFVECNWDGVWGNRLPMGMVYVYNLHNGGKIFVGDFKVVLGTINAKTDATVYEQEVLGVESIDALDYITEENKAFINGYAQYGNITYKVTAPSGAELASTEIATVTADALGTYTIKAYVEDKLLYTGYVKTVLSTVVKDTMLVDVKGLDALDFISADIIGQDLIDGIEKYSVAPSFKLVSNKGGEIVLNGSSLAISDSVLRYYDVMQITINDLVLFEGSFDIFNSANPVVWNEISEDVLGYVSSHVRDYDKTSATARGTAYVGEIGGVNYVSVNYGESGLSSLGAFITVQPKHSLAYYKQYEGLGLTLNYSYTFANYIDKTETDNGDGSTTTTYTQIQRDTHWFGACGNWRLDTEAERGERDIWTSAETGRAAFKSVSISLDEFIANWDEYTSCNPNSGSVHDSATHGYDFLVAICDATHASKISDVHIGGLTIGIGTITAITDSTVYTEDVSMLSSVDAVNFILDENKALINQYAVLGVTYKVTTPAGDVVENTVIETSSFASLGNYTIEAYVAGSLLYKGYFELVNSDYDLYEDATSYVADFANITSYDLSVMFTAISDRLERLAVNSTISYVLVIGEGEEIALDSLTILPSTISEYGVYTLKVLAGEVVVYQGSIEVTNSDLVIYEDETAYSVDFATADSFYITSMLTAVNDKIDRLSAYETITYVLVKGDVETELDALIIEPSTYDIVGEYTLKVLAGDFVIYQGALTISHTGYETVSRDDTEYFIDLSDAADKTRFNFSSKLSAETIARINKIAQYDPSVIATITDVNGTVTQLAINNADVSEIYLDITSDNDLRYYVFEIKAGDKLLAYNIIDLYSLDGTFLWNDQLTMNSLKAIGYVGNDKVKTDFYTIGKGNPTEVSIDGKDYVSFTFAGDQGTWFVWKPLHSKAYYELYKGLGISISATMIVDASGIINADANVLDQSGFWGAAGPNSFKQDTTLTYSSSLDNILAKWDATINVEWDRTWGNRWPNGMVYMYNITNGGKVLIGDFYVTSTQTIKAGDVLVNVEEVDDLTKLDLTKYMTPTQAAVVKMDSVVCEMKGYSIADTIEVADITSIDVSNAKLAAYVLTAKIGDMIVYTANVDLYNTTDTAVWAESLTTDNVIARKLAYSTGWPSASTGRVEYEIVDSFVGGSKTYTGSFIKFTVTEAMNIALDIKALHTKSYYNELVGDSNKIFFVNAYYPSAISIAVNGGFNNAGIHNPYATWRTGTASGWDNVVLSLDNYLIARNASDSITGKWYNWNNIEGTNAGGGNTMVQFEVSSSKATAEAPFVFYVGISKGTGTIVQGGETLATAAQVNDKVVDLSTETSYNLADLLPELSQPKFKAMAKAWVGRKIECCGKVLKGNGLGFILTINGTKHVVVPNAAGEAMLNLDDYVVGQDGVVSTTTLVRDLLTPGENSVSIIGYAKSGNLGGHSTTFLPTATIKVIAPEAVEVEQLSYSNGTSKYMQTADFSADSIDDGNLIVMYTASVQDLNKSAKVSAFQNDVEAIQLQVVPSVDVDEYTFKTTNLTSGENILPAYAFSVFHQLYTEVPYLSSVMTPTPTGTYPDALLPYEVAFNNNLNTMKANYNQGIWINVEIPADQPAGVYKGTFWLIMGLSKYEIPVEVTVFDYAISEDTYMTTSFGMSYTDLLNLETEGEYDADGNLILDANGNKTGTVPQELIDAYSDFLADYRIGFSPIVSSTTFSTAWRGFPYDPEAIFSFDEIEVDGKTYYSYEYPLRKFNENKEVVIYTNGYYHKDLGYKIQSYPLSYQKLDEYFAQMYELAKDPKQGGYRLPVQQGVTSNFNYDNVNNPEVYPNGWSGQMCEIRNDLADGERYNTVLTLTLRDSVEYFFLEAIEKYNETGEFVDVFEKAFVWAVWTDEYSNVPGKIANLQHLLKYMKDFFPDCAEWLRRKHNITDENVLSMLDSLADVRVVMTGQDTDPFDASEDWGEFITTPSNYHSQEQRDEIKAWADSIYNGDGNQWIYTALTPHPYASYLVESPLLSSRLLGWQMGHYDIANMLYWTTMSSKYLDGIQDKYFSELIGKEVEDDEIIDVADFYKQAIHYGSAAGDGFMLYPGSYFGVTGPISSIRMEAIRDSIEDNNLLVDLRTMYELAGHDEGFYNVMDRLTELVYTGVRCKTQAGYVSAFEMSRQSLASMLVLARDYNIFVEDVYMDGDVCKYSVIYPESLKAQIGTDADEAVLINGAAGFRRVFTATSDETISFSFAGQEIVLSIKVLVESAEIEAITFTPNGYNYHASYYTNSTNESRKVEVEEVNLATENDGAGVGGRTEGEYFLVSATEKSYKTNFGISVLPLETKEYYEQYAENAVLEFDVYIEAYTLEGAPVNAYNLYYRLGNGRNSQHTTFKWFTIRINLSTIVENWDAYHTTSTSSGAWTASDRALFVVNGSAYERLSRFYIGNFRFTHI